MTDCSISVEVTIAMTDSSRAPIKDLDAIVRVRQNLREAPDVLLLFELGIHSPFRIGALLGLKVGDVYQHDGAVRSFLSLQDHEKSLAKRIALNGGIRAALIAHVEVNPGVLDSLDAWLFPSTKDARTHVVRQTMWRQLKAAFKRSGLSSHSPESLRKTWGYWHWKRHRRLDILLHTFGKRTPEQLYRFLGIEPGEVYQPGEEEKDLVHLGGYSDLACEIVRNVLEIDRARAAGKRAIVARSSGSLVSPYRDSMVGIARMYYGSRDWEASRAAALSSSGGKCHCGAEATHAHHLAYENWAAGPDELADLAALCGEHHNTKHHGGATIQVPFWAKRAPAAGYVSDELLTALARDFTL